MNGANQRRHRREKAVIDHLTKRMFKPKAADPSDSTTQSSQTQTGLPVEDQVRKRWDPKKGGLPILT